MLTLENTVSHLIISDVVQKSRIYNHSNKWRKYRLLKEIRVCLSNDLEITIPKGFEWDLSSVPRFLWVILPPDGDFEIAALIHDYLYVNQTISKQFSDNEMLMWSNKVNTNRRFSKVDNWVRYYGVKLFGYWAWKN